MTRKQQINDIDLALAVIECVKPPGMCLSTAEIAEIVGCSRQRIWQAQQSGLRKIRRHLAGREIKDYLSD